ncbi:branched-chain amino acid ABC transporter permease [Streptomyces sp. NPDC055078]
MGRTGAGWGVVALLVLVPYIPLSLGGALPGVLNSSGTLQLLAICLVFGALALSYDLLIGYTGMVSFGHALYFALGTYGANVLASRYGVPLLLAAPAAIALAFLVGLGAGRLSLKVTGITFAMVTLAFAEAFGVLVHKNPGGLTGGEEGSGLGYDVLPGWLSGVANTYKLYWLSLAVFLVIWLVVGLAVRSDAGRVWQAVRDNPQRAEVLGYEVGAYRLAAFTLSCTLAGACGVMFLLLVGGASPEVVSNDFTLSILTMVILGGAGYRWGAVIGGALYHYLDVTLKTLSTNETVERLPGILKAPVEQPLFIFGVLLIVVIMAVPGGLVEASERVGRLGRRREERKPGHV